MEQSQTQGLSSGREGDVTRFHNEGLHIKLAQLKSVELRQRIWDNKDTCTKPGPIGAPLQCVAAVIVILVLDSGLSMGVDGWQSTKDFTYILLYNNIYISLQGNYLR